MFSISNIMGHRQSTISGVIMGAFQAAIVGAATSFAQTGNTTNWQQYAWAGAAAAAPVIFGGLYGPTKTAAVPADPFPVTKNDPPPMPDTKAALMARVDAALSLTAQQAMEAEAAKITGQLAQPQG